MRMEKDYEPILLNSIKEQGKFVLAENRIVNQ